MGWGFPSAPTRIDAKLYMLILNQNVRLLFGQVSVSGAKIYAMTPANIQPEDAV